MQVTERHNLGWVTRYHLKFDDEVVSDVKFMTYHLSSLMTEL